MLQRGVVRKNGHGLPEPTTGGFAITYDLTATGKRYAVRLFHRHSPDLEGRYRAISVALEKIQSDYFVKFVFQPAGVRVAGESFPLVKMDWIKGETLGAFLEKNHSNTSAVETVRKDIQKAGAFLASRGIAHGDLQTGNLLVEGQKIRLIDYDGMYVPSMPFQQASELGHRHFQHPLRKERHFDATLDKFSLILIDFSLEVIMVKPEFYSTYATTGENIIFTCNDLIDPYNSDVIKELRALPEFRAKAERFSALCQTPFHKIPIFSDFNSGKWTPATTVVTSKPPGGAHVAYRGAFEVVDATNFEAVRKKTGDKVEMIGKIVEVTKKFTKHKRPYIFINFGDWKKSIAKITIWSAGIAQLAKCPDDSWVGRWVSVSGLVGPSYTNPQHGYTHTGITISAPGQMHLISEKEALYRLGRPKRKTNVTPKRTSNEGLLIDINKRGGTSSTPIYLKPRVVTTQTLPQKPITTNQGLLNQLSQATSQPSPSGSGTGTRQKPQQRSQCFVATACFNDPSHVDVETLRHFRDRVLVRCHAGRLFIAFYYRFGKNWAKWLDCHPSAKTPIRLSLHCLASLLRKVGL